MFVGVNESIGWCFGKICLFAFLLRFAWKKYEAGKGGNSLKISTYICLLLSTNKYVPQTVLALKSSLYMFNNHPCISPCSLGNCNCAVMKCLQCCTWLEMQQTLSQQPDQLEVFVACLNSAQGYVTQYISELAQKSHRSPHKRILAVWQFDLKLKTCSTFVFVFTDCKKNSADCYGSAGSTALEKKKETLM